MLPRIIGELGLQVFSFSIVCGSICLYFKTICVLDSRLLVQDGTGEAHLYGKDRVRPIALGMTDTEWSDLLDLVHKVGQVSYTKSSFFKVQFPLASKLVD